MMLEACFSFLFNFLEEFVRNISERKFEEIEKVEGHAKRIKTQLLQLNLLQIYLHFVVLLSFVQQIV